MTVDAPVDPPRAASAASSSAKGCEPGCIDRDAPGPGSSSRSRGISPACTALDFPDPLGPTTAVNGGAIGDPSRRAGRRAGPGRRSGWRRTRGTARRPMYGFSTRAAAGRRRGDAGCDGSRSGSWRRICSSSRRSRGDGSMPELLGERPCASPGRHAQRVGLPTGSVEGEHLQRPQLLAVRVLAGEPFEVADDGACSPSASRARAAAPRSAARRSSSRRAASAWSDGVVGEVLEGPAAPQRQRGLELGDRRGRVAVEPARACAHPRPRTRGSRARRGRPGWRSRSRRAR